MGAIMINDLRKEITRLKEEVQEKKKIPGIPASMYWRT